MKRRTNRTVPSSCWEQLRKGKVWQRLSLALLVAMMTITAQTVRAQISYSWDEDIRTLIINGTGNMVDYSSKDDQPWSTYRNKITAVVINSGVTSIGSHAFDGCSSLTDVLVLRSESVTSLGSNAFVDCNALANIYVLSDAYKTDTNWSVYEEKMVLNIKLLFVDANVTDSGVGTSPGTALKTLEEALNRAVTGHTIMIAPGTYTGDKNINLNIAKNNKNNLNLIKFGHGEAIFDAESSDTEKDIFLLATSPQGAPQGESRSVNI